MNLLVNTARVKLNYLGSILAPSEEKDIVQIFQRKITHH